MIKIHPKQFYNFFFFCYLPYSLLFLILGEGEGEGEGKFTAWIVRALPRALTCMGTTLHIIIVGVVVMVR